MEQEYHIPTDQSIQIQTPRNSQPQHHHFQDSNSFLLDKIVAHLNFTQIQFLKNIDWQKQLISQIKVQKRKFNKSQNQNVSCDCFSLDTKQQQQLKTILMNILGEKTKQTNLKNLIHEAFLKQSRKNQQSPNFSFSPCELAVSQEVIEFPPVQRVITLNDLAPSTQRHLTITPPSLPPKSPSSKRKEVRHENQKENNFFTFTPKQEVQNIKNDFRSENFDNYNNDKRQRQILLEDSLGRRLFQNEQKHIYIEDESENENIESQVSLNFSLSHDQSKQRSKNQYQGPKFFVQPRQVQSKFEQSSNDNFKHEISQQKCILKENFLITQNLSFKGCPKRKIGKGNMKKQKQFRYQETEPGKLRKMRDSFGNAYQEYFLSESSSNKSKESYLFIYKNRQMEHSLNQKRKLFLD